MKTIIKKTVKPVFEDERGAIFDLVDKGTIKHIGMLTSKPGSIRGSHYHKKAKQTTYIVSGKIELTLKDASRNDSKSKRIIMKAGDIVTIPSMVSHSVKAIEKTTLLVFTDKQRGNGGYEKDTHRIDM